MALPQLGTIDHGFSAVLQTSALPTVDDVDGPGNDGTSSGGLAHDGTVFDYSDAGDAAEITASTNTPTGAFTYMCRVARRPGTTWPPTARIFFASPGSSVNLPGLYYDPAQGASGVIRALIANAGWNTNYDIESWNASEFHVVAMTHDGVNDMNVYVDGVNVGNFTAGPGVVSALITWGTYNSGQSWGNDISDEVFWRGTELTPTEVVDAGDDLNARNATGITGSLAVTDADDTVAASGASGISGGAAVTTSVDSVGAEGSGAVEGVGSSTNEDATVAASGGVAGTGDGTVDSGDDEGAGTGGVGLSGAGAATAEDDVVSGAGQAVSGISGGLAVTDDDDSVAGAAGLGIAGAGASTGDDDSVAGTGEATSGAITGAAAVTEGADSVAASGASGISGSAAVVPEGDSVGAAGTSGIAGEAAATSEPDTIAAFDGLPFHTAPPERTIGARKDNRRIVATKDRRIISGTEL